MKSYSCLYGQFLSRKNILEAIHNASKHKRKRKYVKRICDNPEDYVEYYRNYAMNFKNRKHTPREIYDGIQRKKRVIIVPTFDEQVIHHMVINILKPIFRKSMYYHSYGSLPEKGSLRGMKTIKKWVRDTKNTKYCLKMDIKKYFDSIPNNILKEKLSSIIHDKYFLEVLIEIVNVVHSGIPLGFYTSQWIANWYLNDLDYFIKQKLNAKYYIRYMDDMVVFGANKKELHKMRKEINQYLNEYLGLELKNNWQVFRFSYGKNGEYGRFLDFMGYKFYNNRVTLRSSIFLKIKHKAYKMFVKSKLTIHDCRQLLSYMGWISHTNTYEAYCWHIKPYVTIQNLKRKVSAYDKRMAKCARELVA